MIEELSEAQAEPYWSVFDGFDFLLNVLACDKESARKLAVDQLGLSDVEGSKLTVFEAGHTVTALAARNTFSLFQEHGGVAFEWPIAHGGTRSILREECQVMLESMRHWIELPEAKQLAENVRSDLAFVRQQIADIERLLGDPRWGCYSWIVFNPFRDDNREAAEDEARADAYCNALYTSTPED
jgi:hypothetical protein